VLASADADKHRDRQAHCLAIDDGYASLYQAIIFQALDPLPAGRAGESHLSTECRCGQGGIPLQGVQNLNIESI
jgi:hypothetical protein